MVKVTLSADGAIYFAEISLFLVNLSSLIVGFKSSQQMTYVMTIVHSTELASQIILFILSLAQA